MTGMKCPACGSEVRVEQVWQDDSHIIFVPTSFKIVSIIQHVGIIESSCVDVLKSLAKEISDIQYKLLDQTMKLPGDV